jgi:hypothetical protein
MKVYEKINKVAGTNYSLEQLAKVAYTNGACPICIDEVLNIENYPESLVEFGLNHCQCACGFDCIFEFLKKEVVEIEGKIAETQCISTKPAGA